MPSGCRFCATIVAVSPDLPDKVPTEKYAGSAYEPGSESPPNSAARSSGAVCPDLLTNFCVGLSRCLTSFSHPAHTTTTLLNPRFWPRLRRAILAFFVASVAEMARLTPLCDNSEIYFESATSPRTSYWTSFKVAVPFRDSLLLSSFCPAMSFDGTAIRHRSSPPP